MQESPEQRFDATVSRTLRFDTLVVPRQQESARERLLRCAAAQTMLPPLEAAETSVTLRDQASIIGQHTLRVLNFLFMDSRVYERVRRPARLRQRYDFHWRQAFTFIRLSA